jgi:hypothetical protein
MTSRRPLTLLLAVLAAALCVAGCARSGGTSSAGVGKLLSDTFGGRQAIHGGRLDVALDVTAKGLQSFKGPLSIRLSGPFQTGAAGTLPKFDFNLSFASSGSNIAVGAVSTGTKGYLRLGGHAYVLPGTVFDRLAKSGASKGNSGVSLKTLGIDPRRWVKDVRNLGEEDVAGVRAIHLTAGIDVTRLLGDVDRVLRKAGGLGVTGSGSQLPAGLSPQTRTKITRSIDTARVDIWTGKADHALRRLALDVHFDVPADLRPAGSSGQSGEIKLDLSIANLNQPQPIAAPANPRPLSDLTAALQQLSSAAKGQGSSGSSSAPSAAAASKYDACVTKAGNDLAKIQACSSLLGK